VVREGEIIAAGYHRRAGDNHAEVEALAAMGGTARQGDILYVTLEPCNHFGRTPPCTQAILKSGIRRVVVGMRDPNPGVAGGGCELLIREGLEVRIGVLEEECRLLNEWFLKFSTTGHPFVVAKSAMTLDGWTATSQGHARWVSSEKSRQHVHRMRDTMDAVMVGVGTVVADDPLLTTRIANSRTKDPVRVVVDTHLRIPWNARVLCHSSSSETLIAVGDGVPQDRMEAVKRWGGVLSILRCPIRNGRVDLKALMGILGQRGIASLLVEGGAALMASMIQDRLIDKFCVFQAPKILGGDDGMPMASGPGPLEMGRCIRLTHVTVKRVGEDILVEGYPDYPA
jgi:diaminohydroxyphosphoribosylaminopyrimidine deaminase/5-amino-6-(5-phosphoribosylamino)uracil reductase